VENWNEPTIVVVVIFNCIIIYPIRVSDSENNAVSKKKNAMLHYFHFV